MQNRRFVAGQACCIPAIARQVGQHLTEVAQRAAWPEHLGPSLVPVPQSAAHAAAVRPVTAALACHRRRAAVS